MSSNKISSEEMVSSTEGDDGGGDGGVSSSTMIKEQDRLLPIANVGRLMKKILPPNAKISKEAKETMQECVSEFISFVTGEASNKCQKEKRKTVNGDDICCALLNLGFDNYAEPMRLYLQKYRETEGDRAAASGSGSHKGADDLLMFKALDRNNDDNSGPSATRRY